MPQMPSMLPPLTGHALLHTWGWRPVWDALILLALVAYLAGVVLGRRRGARAVSPARALSFVVGLAVLFVTLNSAVDVYAMAVFWDHMIEHLLLIMVVPALLVLGHPIEVTRTALPASARAHLDRVLHSLPVRVATNPLVALLLYTVVIVGTHLTSFMDQMAMHGWLMNAEQVLYLGAGYLAMLPLLGTEPSLPNLPYLFRIAAMLFAMTPDTVVGIVLMQTQKNVFPVMHAAHPAWAPSAVKDQQIGGALMWAAGDGLMMLFAVAIVVALIANPTRGTVLGSWLEAVRRGNLAAHVASQVPDTTAFTHQTDVDSDDQVLAAYNQMLQRLQGQEQGRA